MMVVVLLVVCFEGPIQERLFGDDRGSVASRIPLNGLALAMIEDHPLFGVGTNNFSLAMQPYLAHSFSGEFLYTVHNTYLLVWTEIGTGGLIAFVWFLIAIVYQALKVWRLREHLLSPLALGCGAAIIGFIIQMNFDPFREGAAGHLVWLLGGLVVVLHRLSSGNGIPFAQRT
jgi:putative inorganic carbon (HCO3(-)) transporter